MWGVGLGSEWRLTKAWGFWTDLDDVLEFVDVCGSGHVVVVIGTKQKAIHQLMI